MNFKKASVDFVVVTGFVTVIIVGFVAMYQIISLSTSEGSASRLQQSIADSEREIQGVKQVFEQTAIFFGLMNTANELGAHGGVSSDALLLPEDAYTPWMQSDSSTLYWAVARCDNTAGNPTSVIKKRTPYLLNEDYNISVKAASTSALLVDGAKYSQNLEEVMNGGYNLYAGVQVLLLKPGTVTLTICQPSRCATDFVVQTTGVSGTVVIPFGSGVVKSNSEDVDIYISGDVDDVAIVRQIAVSIYNRDVVLDSDKLLTKNINIYWDKAVLLGQKVTVKPFEASFVPAGEGIYKTLDSNQGFLKGISWAPNKASAAPTTLAESNLAARVVTEEDVQLRYWRIQGFAKFFVDNYEAWIKPRWFNRLNQFSDHYMDYADRCGPQSYSGNCPPDRVVYSAESFRVAIEDETGKLADQLSNAFGSVDVNWTITVPSSVFVGCPVGGTSASAPAASCNSDNMEYYQYKSGWTENQPSCSSCSRCDGCPGQNRCFMHYDHRYILKNVPVMVTITDKKYNVFDSAKKTWVPYKFTFMVEIDKVDDNSCDNYNHVCSTQSGGPEGPKAVPIPDVPPEITAPPKETCLEVYGQTCETGETCPAVKLAGVGVCNEGTVCCAPDESKRPCSFSSGVCTAVLACPSYLSVVDKNTLSDCQGATELCCAVSADTSITLTYSDTYGSPQKPWAMSLGCGSTTADAGLSADWTLDTDANVWKGKFLFSKSDLVSVFSDPICVFSPILSASVIGNVTDAADPPNTQKIHDCQHISIWNGETTASATCTQTFP